MSVLLSLLKDVFPGKSQAVKSRKVLNVGGNSKEIPLPPEYAGFDHWLLDIDPKGSPDIVCDARELATLEGGAFDAVYCSHNLEHYYRHDVPRVLAGFLHMLKDGGFAHIRVPDINEVMRLTIERGLDIDDVLYTSPSGPIMVLDVLYGYAVQIERSGQDFYAASMPLPSLRLTSWIAESSLAGISIYPMKGNSFVSIAQYAKGCFSG